MRIFGVHFLVNERGAVLVLHNVGDICDEIGSYNRYINDTEFYADSYSHCQRAYNEISRSGAVEFDSTFFVVIGAAERIIKWDIVKTKYPSDCPFEIHLFAEAIFAFTACRQAERVLSELLSSPDIDRVTGLLISHSQDLIHISKPERFLVSKIEISIMKNYYDEWKIARDTDDLQGKFSQIIDTFNLRYNRIQSQRSISIAYIAASIAMISLISVIEPLLRFSNAVSVDAAYLVIALVALLFIMMSMHSSFVRWLHRGRSSLRVMDLHRRLRRFKVED